MTVKSDMYMIPGKSIMEKEDKEIVLVNINRIYEKMALAMRSISDETERNKVVKVLFDYLNLNISYRLILYRLKNASISGKIEATKKYSRLLKDLFFDGCFDEKAPLKSIIESRIQYYQNNYSLEELGIDNESPFIGLTTLIQLIQPELRLTELETIKKSSNE